MVFDAIRSLVITKKEDKMIEELLLMFTKNYVKKIVKTLNKIVI